MKKYFLHGQLSTKFTQYFRDKLHKIYIPGTTCTIVHVPVIKSFLILAGLIRLNYITSTGASHTCTCTAKKQKVVTP